MTVSVSSLFPIALGKADERYNLNSEERNWMRSLDVHDNYLNRGTVRSDVLKDEEAKSLLNFIQKNLDEFFYTTYNPSKDTQIKIVQSWFNFTGKDQAHHRHSHPNSFISGVYYPHCVPNDSIVFHSSVQSGVSPMELCIWNKHGTAYHNKETRVDVSTGELILFPSSVEHSVPMVTVDGDERISLAFNTFVEGTFGEDQFKNKVTIKVIDD
jgi:uncharacterized protein (TIGR02466 family)